MPKVVYYSPYGGEILGVLDQEDPDYEDAYARSNGYRPKKTSVANAQAPGSQEWAGKKVDPDGKVVNR